MALERFCNNAVKRGNRYPNPQQLRSSTSIKDLANGTIFRDCVLEGAERISPAGRKMVKLLESKIPRDGEFVRRLNLPKDLQELCLGKFVYRLGHIRVYDEEDFHLDPDRRSSYHYNIPGPKIDYSEHCLLIACDELEQYRGYRSSWIPEIPLVEEVDTKGYEKDSGAWKNTNMRMVKAVIDEVARIVAEALDIPVPQIVAVWNGYGFVVPVSAYRQSKYFREIELDDYDFYDVQLGDVNDFYDDDSIFHGDDDFYDDGDDDFYDDLDSSRRYQKTNPDRRLNSQRLNANIESEDISPEEKDAILEVFKRNNVSILDSYFDVTEDETYDYTYNVFVVSTENMNATVLGYLQSDLRELEDDFDIGFEVYDGDDGFYSKRYEFYHYIDDIEDIDDEDLDSSKRHKKMNCSDERLPTHSLEYDVDTTGELEDYIRNECISWSDVRHWLENLTHYLGGTVNQWAQDAFTIKNLDAKQYNAWENKFFKELQSYLGDLEDEFPDFGLGDEDLNSSKRQKVDTAKSKRMLNASLSDDFISQVNRAVRTRTGFIIARKAVSVDLGDGTYMFLVEDEDGLYGILQNGQQIDFQDEGEAQGYIENSWL